MGNPPNRNRRSSTSSRGRSTSTSEFPRMGRSPRNVRKGGVDIKGEGAGKGMVKQRVYERKRRPTYRGGGTYGRVRSKLLMRHVKAIQQACHQREENSQSDSEEKIPTTSPATTTSAELGDKQPDISSGGKDESEAAPLHLA
eukprot:scaffold1053_cov332-Pavlova_lutheri.AAC.19